MICKVIGSANWIPEQMLLGSEKFIFKTYTTESFTDYKEIILLLRVRNQALPAIQIFDGTKFNSIDMYNKQMKSIQTLWLCQNTMLVVSQK